MESYKKKNNIGNKLQKLLKERNVTVTELANSIELNRVTVQRYLSGAKCPSDRTLEKIAEYFEMPVEFFTDEPFVNNDQSLIDQVENVLSEKLDAQKQNQYKKSAIKAFNYYFDSFDPDLKNKAILDLYEIINTALKGKEFVDFKNYESDQLDETLNQLYMVMFEKLITLYGNDYRMKHINQREILERIKAGNYDHKIERKQINVYKQGFEAGVLSSLSNDTFYKYKSLEEIKRNSINKIEIYSHYFLCTIDDILVDLQNRFSFKSAIKDIDCAITHINLSESNESWEVSYFVEKLQKVEDCLYKPASEIVIDMTNGDTDKLLSDLNELKIRVQFEIDEIVKLAKNYQ